jgi:membrane protein DedA with SNARE-associated domain
VEQLSHFFLTLVDHAGYGGLFVVMVLGNMGVPVGTEIVMPVAGALAAVGHLSSWWLAAMVGTVGEVVGGSLLYAIGYAGGRPFVARWGRYVKLSEKKLDVFHAFYERHGNVVVFVCRFIPFVRGVSALPAGVSRMQKRYFVAYTALGSALFCFALAWLGSSFGRHIDTITPLIHRSAVIVVVLLVLAAAGYAIATSVRARRKRAAGAPSPR